MRFLRFLLAGFFFAISFHAGATTYYVSNEGRDGNNGTSPGSTWSFQKLQTALSRKKGTTIQPGDVILLKRGAVYNGTLTFGTSGTAAAPITLGAYGAGSKPVLNGFVTVARWQPLGGGIWESSERISGLQSCNMVTINGVQYGQGRYPNEDAPNKGYLTIDQSGDDSTTITDAALPASANNWTGAKAVVRIAHYILDTATILNHQGITITTKRLYHQPPKGYGFFITNDPRTIDKHGEWYYNPATGKIRIKLQNNPASYSIKVAATDTLINCDRKSFITIQDLRLEGANRFGTYHRNSAGNMVQRCEIVGCGDEGISAADAENFDFTALDNFISDCGDYAIMARFVKKGLNVQRNNIRRIGIFEQNGGYGTICRIGISVATGTDHEIAYNRVDSTGFTGIRFSGSNVQVHHNLVQNYDFVMDDGGGIHTGNAAQGKHRNRKVWRNIVLNGIGAPAGTGGVNQACAFYVDDAAHDVALWENVAAYGGDAGIYLHNNWNVYAHHNLVFDFKDAAAQIVYDNKKWGVPYSISFTDNTLIAKEKDGWLLKFLDRRDSADLFSVVLPQAGSSEKTTGSINNNIYARPLNEAGPKIYVGWFIYQKPKEQIRKYTVQQFGDRFGYDIASVGSKFRYAGAPDENAVFKFVYNATGSDSTVTLQGAWKTVDGRSIPQGPLKLQPFSAMVLLKAEGIVPNK